MRKSRRGEKSALAEKVSCGVKRGKDEGIRREKGNGVLIFSSPALRSAEVLESQLPSDWPKLQCGGL